MVGVRVKVRVRVGRLDSIYSAINTETARIGVALVHL